MKDVLCSTQLKITETGLKSGINGKSKLTLVRQSRVMCSYQGSSRDCRLFREGTSVSNSWTILCNGHLSTLQEFYLTLLTSHSSGLSLKCEINNPKHIKSSNHFLVLLANVILLMAINMYKILNQKQLRISNL